MIFVGGIHGVGKTTTCQDLAEKLGLRHKSASEIIREERAEAISLDSKRVDDVPGNQRLLLRGIQRYVVAQDSLLLDGHLTIINSHGAIDPIDISVFERLGIDLIVVIEDEPDAIVSRLNTRDGYTSSAETVAAHQEAEVAHAKELAASLGIRLIRAKPFDGATLEAEVAKHYGVKGSKIGTKNLNL